MRRQSCCVSAWRPSAVADRRRRRVSRTAWSSSFGTPGHDPEADGSNMPDMPAVMALKPPESTGGVSRLFFDVDFQAARARGARKGWLCDARRNGNGHASIVKSREAVCLFNLAHRGGLLDARDAQRFSCACRVLGISAFDGPKAPWRLLVRSRDECRRRPTGSEERSQPFEEAVG
jgi:hypothetical protein